MLSFLALGSVVLAVTGGEALYADMGHFGRSPIAPHGSCFVQPALLLNYFGQGALLIKQPAAVFLVLRVGPVLGALSDGGAGDACHHYRQPGGDQRGVLDHPPGGAVGAIAPHGNPSHLGHRARPDLCPAYQYHALRRVVLIVLIFKSSLALGSAYGIAVTGALALDARGTTRWRAAADRLRLLRRQRDREFPRAAGPAALIGFASFTVLTTWKRGRELVRNEQIRQSVPLSTVLKLTGPGIARAAQSS